MDRAYLDFERLYHLHQSSAVFVTRSKTNTGLRRIYSHKVDKNAGIRYDQTVALTGFYSKKDPPEKLRCIKYFDAEIGRSFIFLTNQFTLPAKTIADLYRYRWRIEIFFKWIKQHLRIKRLYGTSKKCCQNPNLNCSLHLCPGRHYEKTNENRLNSLHYFTDFEHHAI